MLINSSKIIFILCNFQGNRALLIENILIYASLVLTLVSLVDYILKNRGILGGEL